MQQNYTHLKTEFLTLTIYTALGETLWHSNAYSSSSYKRESGPDIMPGPLSRQLWYGFINATQN